MGGGTGRSVPPPWAQKKMGEMWEWGKRGERMGKKGEGERKKTKQKNRTGKLASS